MSERITPRQRPDTWDHHVLESVINLREYGTIDFRDRTVVDVGAHIGAFTLLAARHGARRVLAFEAGSENFEMLQANCGASPGVECRHAAVWGGGESPTSLVWRPNAHAENTGGGTVVPCTSVAGFGFSPDGAETVHTVPLDRIVEELGRIDLLKIDAEGSEYPILLGSRLLNRVGEIVGEFHTLNSPQAPDSTQWNITQLVRHLQAEGFIVERDLHPENGIFRAFRPQSRVS